MDRCIHCGDALVDHGPRTSVASLVHYTISGPVPRVMPLAANDDRQQRPIRFPLRATFRIHSLESIEHLGKLCAQDGVKLSLRRMFSKAVPTYSINNHVPLIRHLETRIRARVESC